MQFLENRKIVFKILKICIKFNINFKFKLLKGFTRFFGKYFQTLEVKSTKNKPKIKINSFLNFIHSLTFTFLYHQEGHKLSLKIPRKKTKLKFVTKFYSHFSFISQFSDNFNNFEDFAATMHSNKKFRTFL